MVGRSSAGADADDDSDAAGGLSGTVPWGSLMISVHSSRRGASVAATERSRRFWEAAKQWMCLVCDNRFCVRVSIVCRSTGCWKIEFRSNQLCITVQCAVCREVLLQVTPTKIIKWRGLDRASERVGWLPLAALFGNKFRPLEQCVAEKLV